uniref:Uncharacterized protein n=1 Tax=Chromera velia CCMP2878 TaxID=1169474 RepID=A0A0G4HQG4_9ALVE|eukprot:Cvel_30181.t1-p1 / transcript=Cvel_30181.t1 / gene=Cvel_30181 / organism=Chromera_velia_CCMP2878 / gene_product=hypothetical protein / transcript_product=hypothetical protein / location=Cvel_scaffold4266:3759-5569(-) / protein_length=350 / sequence_SO=supercontig / SO=protein_coding / is_pseudo=false
MIFECYDPEQSEAAINAVWIPEDFLTQLHRFPDNCAIQIIDLHGPSFDVVDQTLDRFLRELGHVDEGGDVMLPSSMQYLESRQATDNGFKMDLESSRYNYANRAVILTLERRDLSDGQIYTHKVIFRVCPHIMQSQIASTLVYCLPPTAARADGTPFENWGERLFATPQSFGEALIDAQGRLAARVQQPVLPLWRQSGRVYIAYRAENPADPQVQWDAQQIAEGLRQSLGLDHPVQRLSIAPYNQAYRDLAGRLEQLVQSSMWISLIVQGQYSSPVAGKHLANFIRLCFAGFQNAFNGGFVVEETQRAHAALLRNLLVQQNVAIIQPQPQPLFGGAAAAAAGPGPNQHAG